MFSSLFACVFISCSVLSSQGHHTLLLQNMGEEDGNVFKLFITAGWPLQQEAEMEHLGEADLFYWTHSEGERLYIAGGNSEWGRQTWRERETQVKRCKSYFTKALRPAPQHKTKEQQWNRLLFFSWLYLSVSSSGLLLVFLTFNGLQQLQPDTVWFKQPVIW